MKGSRRKQLILPTTTSATCWSFWLTRSKASRCYQVPWAMRLDSCWWWTRSWTIF